MKIVFVSYVASLGFSKPEAWLKRINFCIGTLDALAINHTVISIEQINYEGDHHINNVQYYFRKSPKAERLFPFQLHHLIKDISPDVVIVNGMRVPLQLIQMRLTLGKKTVIMTQHHAEKPFGGFKKLIAKWAYRKVDACLFASKQLSRDWVDSGIINRPEKVHEAMPVSSVFAPVDRQAAQLKTGVSGENNFLWIGNLNANKDPLTAVKAFLQYVELQPAAHLYMIYQTNDLLNEIKSELSKHPLSAKSIALVGKIEHSQLLYWFNSVDFIISSSHNESGGAALCEALSCGCIPVVTDIFSFRTITRNGSIGRLYQAGDETDLLDKLKQTANLNKAEERAKALDHFKSTLSFEAIAGQIMRIVASCLSK